MIETKEYKKAYKECLMILAYLPKEELAKIPEQQLNFFFENMDFTHEYYVKNPYDLTNQEMLPITEAILANLFRDYLATEYQKERILQKEKNDLAILEEEKKKKYNPDDIFKKKENLYVKEMDTNTEMVVYEESLLQKMIKIFTKIKEGIKKYLQK